MNNLLIIITVYEKKISDLPVFLNAKANHDIFIYDNSFLSQTIPNIEGISIHYIHAKENSGVSKAYNTGILKAKDLHKKYILLLDQDTKLNLDDISVYMKLEKKYGDKFIYAPIIGKQKKIYSPFRELFFVGQAQNKDQFNYQEVYPIEGKSLINSGLMIPLSIIDQAGRFNEKIKLDFSDIYFIEKYKEKYNKIILVNLWLEHSLSGDEGLDFDRELNRFKFYCNGAKELSRSLQKSTQWTVLRRMIRLIQKYKTFQPISIYFQYYIRNKII